MSRSATTPARLLAYAVILCVAGAGLALFAATRTWLVEVTPRPAPLPELRAPRTGGDLVPWLPGLAVVGLAGGGALLATRGAVRRGVGGLLAVAGLGIAGGAAAALSDATARGWPVLCVLGGVMLMVAGIAAVVRGREWPALGARYDRRAAPPPATRAGTADTVAAWEALDRGEDPTDA
jgi:Tryptophan-associated transmembrane protein (Trp_oprn_chp)